MTSVAAVLVILVDTFVFSLLNPWREPHQSFQSDMFQALLPMAVGLVVPWLFSHSKRPGNRESPASPRSPRSKRIFLGIASGVLLVETLAAWFAGQFAGWVLIVLAVLSAAGFAIAASTNTDDVGSKQAPC